MKRDFCTEATLYSGMDGLFSNTFWGSKRQGGTQMVQGPSCARGRGHRSSHPLSPASLADSPNARVKDTLFQWGTWVALRSPSEMGTECLITAHKLTLC